MDLARKILEHFLMSERQDILNNRKSFLVYFDWAKYVDKLTTEQNGSLFEAMVKLAMTGEDTDFSDDLVLDMVWIGVSDAIKRDTEKYIVKCKKNRENGATGGRPRKDEKNPEKPNGYFGLSTETKRNPEKPDIDIDKDKDTKTNSDTDNDIDSDKDKDIVDGNNNDVIGTGFSRTYVYAQFIETWNTYSKYGVERIENLNQYQKDKIDQLVKLYDWVPVHRAMVNIGNSDYLLGQVDGSSPIKLNWFLTPANIEKILADKYTTNKKNKFNGFQ